MRRIQRATDKEAIVKAMTDGDQPCFREIFRLLIFASMLGRKLGRREPLGPIESGKGVPDAYFTNSPVWPGLLYLHGLVETSSTHLLQGSPQAEDELATIFEEYANGGLAFLKERFDGKDVDVVSMVDLITELSAEGALKPNLTEIEI